MFVIDEDATFSQFDLELYGLDKLIDQRGYIYVVKDTLFPNHVKIGRTTNLFLRLTDYNKAKPYPTASFIAFSILFKNVILVERKILNHLYNKTSPTTFRKEWFEKKHLQLILELIEKAEKEPRFK
jgi:hypothetical protein